MVNSLVVCGGTFDHFHKGHEKFLNYALSFGSKIIVGLTSDEYVKNSKFKIQNPKLIEDYEIRKKSLEEFLIREKAQDRVSILKIDDLFGPTLARDLPIEGIVVSEDSKKGAGIINAKRKELGLKELSISIAPQIVAEDGELISSAKIRAGVIDRLGRLYVKPQWLKTGLVLSEDLRQEFREPIGNLYSEVDLKTEQNSSCMITVGDATTKKFNENSIRQNISVIDFKVAREEKFTSFSQLGFEGNEKVIIVNNPAGHITADLFNAVSEIFKTDFQNRIILKVIGEEDLAVLPIILSSPLGASVFYGQPGEGLVKVTVSQESKHRAHSLLLKLKHA